MAHKFEPYASEPMTRTYRRRGDSFSVVLFFGSEVSSRSQSSHSHHQHTRTDGNHGNDEHEEPEAGVGHRLENDVVGVGNKRLVKVQAVVDECKSQQSEDATGGLVRLDERKNMGSELPLERPDSARRHTNSGSFAPPRKNDPVQPRKCTREKHNLKRDTEERDVEDDASKHQDAVVGHRLPVERSGRKRGVGTAISLVDCALSRIPQ
jgi:hypothetical protein